VTAAQQFKRDLQLAQTACNWTTSDPLETMRALENEPEH
jgi:hypothetical protein